MRSLERRARSLKLAGTMTVLATLLAACAPDSGGAPGRTSGTTRPIELTQFRLGAELGNDGAVTALSEKSTFNIGEQVHLSMRVVHAPPGTPIEVIWRGPENEKLGGETKTVRPGQVHVHFSADTSSLPAGKAYKVAVAVQGRSITQIEFDLEDPLASQP